MATIHKGTQLTSHVRLQDDQDNKEHSVEHQQSGTHALANDKATSGNHNSNEHCEAEHGPGGDTAVGEGRREATAFT